MARVAAGRSARAPSDDGRVGPGGTPDRAALETAWLRLTREDLPRLARSRPGWPVTRDHCFQRILLDNALGGRWYDHVEGRPAYRHVAADALARAVALGQAVVAGKADLAALDARSLAWRGKTMALRRKTAPA